MSKLPHVHMRIKPESIPVDFFRRFGGADKVLVEIGTFAGEFAVVAAPHFEHVHCIDPWDFNSMNDLRAGRHNLARLKNTAINGATIEGHFDANTRDIANITKLKAYDSKVVSQFNPGSVDVLYIDSEHTFESCGLTALRWWPKLKPDGVLAGHDYSLTYPQVIELVDVLSKMLERFPLVYPDTTWAFDLGGKRGR